MTQSKTKRVMTLLLTLALCFGLVFSSSSVAFAETAETQYDTVTAAEVSSQDHMVGAMEATAPINVKYGPLEEVVDIAWVDGIAGELTYSSLNISSTYRVYKSAESVEVSKILSEAGIDISRLNNAQEILFTATDNNKVTLTWGQLTEDRYQYDYGVADKAAVTDPSVGTQVLVGSEPVILPAIISLDQGEDSPRLFIGQKNNADVNNEYLIKKSFP